MKTVWKRLMVFLMLILVTSLVACGQDNGSTETVTDDESDSADASLKQVVIGWSPPDITGVFKTATDFMEAAAEDAQEAGLDVEVITRAATTHTSVADQVDSINNLVQRGVDVLIVSPADVEAVKPALDEAIGAGVPVILVNLLEPIEGLDVSSYIGFNNAQAAKVSAYSLLDALGGPGVLGEGETIDVASDEFLDLAWWEEVYQDVDRESISGKVAIIEGIAGEFFSNERVRGFMEVIDEFPNIEVVSLLPADWDRQKGVEAAENILQANSELDAIWAASNEMGLGALSAVEAAERNEVMVITNDGTPESVDLIRQGKLVAETWHGFPEWGWYGTKFGVMLALGQEVPETYDIRPRTIYQENADNFYPDTDLEPIDWAEILNQ